MAIIILFVLKITLIYAQSLVCRLVRHNRRGRFGDNHAIVVFDVHVKLIERDRYAVLIKSGLHAFKQINS